MTHPPVCLYHSPSLQHQKTTEKWLIYLEVQGYHAYQHRSYMSENFGYTLRCNQLTWIHVLHTHTLSQSHLLECPKLPVTCEQCQEKLEREKVCVCVCVKRRRLTRVLVQRHCWAEDHSQRQQWREDNIICTYIGQPLAVAASNSVAALVSWLIYKCSDTIERMIPGGSNDEKFTDVDTHATYAKHFNTFFPWGSPACIHTCPNGICVSTCSCLYPCQLLILSFPDFCSLFPLQLKDHLLYQCKIEKRPVCDQKVHCYTFDKFTLVLSQYMYLHVVWCLLMCHVRL